MQQQPKRTCYVNRPVRASRLRPEHQVTAGLVPLARLWPGRTSSLQKWTALAQGCSLEKLAQAQPEYLAQPVYLAHAEPLPPKSI